MVRSVSTDTNDTERIEEPVYPILNEFYGLKCLHKPIRNYQFLSKFIKYLLKLIERTPKISIRASDASSTRNAILFAYISLQIKTMGITLPKRFIVSKTKSLFSNQDFRFLYLLACKAIFSLPLAQLCTNLKIKCCNSSMHFEFCKQKWRELESYSICNIPKVFGFTPVTTYSISDLVDTIFIN